MNVTLRQLKTFEAVARHASFTRAAEELYLTQPAVSMQIKQLENTVGVALFEQLGRKIHLTEAGRELHDCSRAVAAHLAETGQVIEELKGVRHGRLSVAVASTVNYFAARLLAAFCQRFPGVKVSLGVTNREGLLRQLAANETDIVLMGKPPAGLDLVAEPFMTNPLVIIAAPSHSLAQHQSIPVRTLENETFLVRERGSGTRMAMERFLTESGVTIARGMEMNSNEAIKQSVEAGLGLSMVSVHTIELEREAGRLIVLPVDSFPVLRRWYVVHRKGKRLSSVTRTFKDFVLHEAAACANPSVPPLPAQ